MQAKKPDAGTVHKVLHDILLVPLCKNNEAAITQRIKQCPPSEKLTKLLKKYDMASIVTIAKNLVDTRHRQLAAEQHKLCAAKAPIPSEARSGPSSKANCPAPASIESPAQSRSNTDDSQRETTSPVQLSARKGVPATCKDEQLPYHFQHLIFVELQTVLEALCYRFTTRVFPDIIESQGWDCATAMELSVWSGVMKSYDARIRPYLQMTTTQVKETLDALILIRNTTVHRVPLHIHAIEYFLAISKQVAEELGDKSHQVAISRLQHLAVSACDKRELHRAGNTAIIQHFDLQRADAQRRFQTKIEQLNLAQHCQQQIFTDDFIRKMQFEYGSGSWSPTFDRAWTYVCDQASTAAGYLSTARRMLPAVPSLRSNTLADS